MKVLRVLDALALVILVATYWTIELFYAWFKAWGDPHFDLYYSPLAYLGIGVGLYLFMRAR